LFRCIGPDRPRGPAGAIVHLDPTAIRSPLSLPGFPNQASTTERLIP
jgi:hypothetical protein